MYIEDFPITYSEASPPLPLGWTRIFSEDKVIFETKKFFDSYSSVGEIPIAGIGNIPILIPRKHTVCSVCGNKPKWYKRTHVFEVVTQKTDSISFTVYNKNQYGCGTYTACSEACRNMFTLAA